MRLQLLDQKSARLPIIGVLSVVCLLALIRLSGAVIDYEAYEMDRNAPTIQTAPHIPQPWHHDLRVRPAVPRGPSSVCDDECKQREVVFI